MLVCTCKMDYTCLIVFILSFVKCSPSSVSVLPYSFSLSPSTHQLETTWEVRGLSVSLLCGLATVSLVEIPLTGKSRELSDDSNSWAITCEHEDADKMVIEVDVTKFRVQPFKSYKVCISLEEDYSWEMQMEEVCTHLFSFEKSVPYIPERNSIESDTSMILRDTQKYIEEKYKELEEGKTSSLYHTGKVSDIERFIEDDQKTSFLKLEDREELEKSLALLNDIQSFTEPTLSSSLKLHFSSVILSSTIIAANLFSRL